MSRDEKLIAEARALVETWRQYVKRCETAANNGFDQDWSLVNCTRQCADELEALLAEQAEPPAPGPEASKQRAMPHLIGAQKHLETCAACNHGRTPCSEYRSNYEKDSALDGVECADGRTCAVVDGISIGKSAEPPALIASVQRDERERAARFAEERGFYCLADRIRGEQP